MPYRISDLLNPKTAEQIFNESLGLLQGKKFPVTNWRTGGPYKTLVGMESVQLEIFYQLLAAFVSSGFLLEAEEGWLDLLSESWFAEKRMLALFTKGQVTLTANVGTGPYVFKPGGLVVSTPFGRKYRSINDITVTLPKGGTVTLLVQAEKAGVEYNVPVGTITQLDSPTYLGVSVNNPGVFGGDWIVSAGADIEPDDRYQTRCLNKWGTLGTGFPKSACIYWALSASSEVAKVSVCSGLKDDGYFPNWITIYLAGDGASVSNAAVKAVKDLIDPKLPENIYIDYKKASIVEVMIRGVVSVYANFNTVDTQGQIQNSLARLERMISIGGAVIFNQIVASIIFDEIKVKDVVLSSLSGNLTIRYNEIVKFVVSLDYVSV